MSLFNYQPGKGLSMAPQVGYYFLATAVLMIFTIGLWIIWERRFSTKKIEDEEKGSKDESEWIYVNK